MPHFGLAVVLLVAAGLGPALVAAQQPADPAAELLEDFLHPCATVVRYLQAEGVNPAGNAPGVRAIRERGHDVMASALAYLAQHPALARDPAAFRASVRARLAGPFYGRDTAEEAAAALDTAVTRYWAGDWGPEGGDELGLAIVARLMDAPPLAEFYRNSVRHAWRGRRIQATLGPVAPPCPLAR